MVKMMVAAKFDPTNNEMMMKFTYFCEYSIPADKEMLPKMVALLWEFNKSGAKMNQWYFKMQECVKNHHRTKGNCFFFKDAKEILKGDKVFDVKDANRKNKERIDNCIKFSGPFGLQCYI